MGYYSTYALTWEYKGTDTTQAEISERIINAFADLPYWSAGGFDVDSDDSIYISEAKWYDYSEDMYDLSVQFPDVVFHLWGDGESADDLWEEHWQNGKTQHCAAEIPPYDPMKMVDYKRRCRCQ